MDAGGTGRSSGAGRGHMQVCYSRNSVGHKADVCPNNTANWSEDPNLVESHVARTVRLRSLSQQLNVHGCMMMMIAFITFKSSLVPLFEGL